MLRYLLFLSTILCLASCARVLLISLDGLRWDYISKAQTPNLDRLTRLGSHVVKVTSAYTTLTFPNHFSLVTGLYVEDHGIIANRFYEPSTGEVFTFGSDTKWFNSTEPIWVTAEREGKKSGAYMWVGNLAVYEGVTVSKVTPFNNDELDFRLAIDRVTDWFVQDDLQLACLYTPEPDKTGHVYGPNSEEVKGNVEDLDSDIGYLLDKLGAAGLSDEIDIIITSDHGMTDISDERTIDMSLYLDLEESVEWSSFGSIGLIVPKPGKFQQVFDSLNGVSEHFTVYAKEDIPDNLRYKNSDRIPDIVIVVDQGWILKSRDFELSIVGQHGYDNKEDDMKTTLIAYGPYFRQGYKQPAMNNVDLYPLMCQLLGLRTCHRNSGLVRNTIRMVNWRAIWRDRRQGMREKSRQWAEKVWRRVVRKPALYWYRQARQAWIAAGK